MYYCGVDVAKRKHVALMMDSQGQIVKRAFSFDNSRSGFDELLAVLAAQPEPVTAGLEATGHYWLALYEALTRQGYPVVVLNPLQVHAYQRTGLRKCKSDRVDSFWVADYVRISQRPPAAQATMQILQLRELSRFRYRLGEQIGECKQKTLNILERVFPEYEKLFSDIFLQSSRRLLERAVSPHEFAEFDLAELSEVLQQASRGRLGLEKAQAIQAAARQSIGYSFLTDAVRIEMRCLLAQIELLETQRAQVDTALVSLLEQMPQYLTTIPGIGLATGAMILAEIGDVQRFDSLEKLVAYAGINATVYQSGQFEADEAHMSKRGSPYLRWALWQAAVSAAKADPELKTYYERKLAEGKKHGTIIGAICRKLLARIFVVLKEQRPYVLRKNVDAGP